MPLFAIICHLPLFALIYSFNVPFSQRPKIVFWFRLKHSGDDVPLKKLTTPKRSRPPTKTDLRKKLDNVPVFSKTKLHNDKGPVQSRISRDLPGPWKTGSDPNCGTEHRHRPFIASGDCARYEVSPSKNWSNSQQENSMVEKEERERLSEDDITTDECEKEDSSQEKGA